MLEFKKIVFLILLLLSTAKPKGKSSLKLLGTILSIQAKFVPYALLNNLLKHMDVRMRLSMFSFIPFSPQRMNGALHCIPDTILFLHSHSFFRNNFLYFKPLRWVRSFKYPLGEVLHTSDEYEQSKKMWSRVSREELQRTHFWSTPFIHCDTLSMVDRRSSIASQVMKASLGVAFENHTPLNQLHSSLPSLIRYHVSFEENWSL